MCRVSALTASLFALTTATCTAFIPPSSVLRVVGMSQTTMSLKGPGRSSSPISKAARIVNRVLFTRPVQSKSGGNNGNGMIGGGDGGGVGGFGPFSMDDDENAEPLAAMGLLAGASGLWEAYNEALEDNPILVKACTSLVGFSIGDILAQQGTKKSKDEKFSYERLARMAAFGFLFHGTISHFFYNALDGALPGTAAITVIQKVLIDQVLWAPIFTIIFFTWLGVTSGASPSEIVTKIKNDLVKGVVGSWTVWPLAHTINFRFVPTEQRLLYINSIQIFYNVFLSIIGSK